MTNQTYPKNAWYVAAMSEEIGLEKPLGRTICGERIAFYRPSENDIAAVLDFCPHRGAALSLGYVEDGLLVCGYHGLKIGEDGKTKEMPLQRVQGFPCMKSYAVEERYGFIWVWTGDQSKADEALIPHLEWAVSDDWAYGGGLYHIKCDYRLMIDNLMDLTHETYVHASSIGQKEIDESPVSTQVLGGEVITSRYMENIMAPPFWQAALKANGLADDVPVDRWQRCRFTPPSNVMIDVGVAHAGKGGFDAPKEFKASSIVVDFITPENDDTMWYFWGMARNFKPNDDALTDNIRDGQGGIFQEDLEVLECQQINLKSFPEYDLLKLNIDAGGVQSRRIIERIIQEEQKSSKQESTANNSATTSGKNEEIPLQTVSF
ncbi:aromatic ring-hydroxylating oxygenase subunit alpha [Marinomonas balearica]|uniref:Vanillate O-demethylase monooxygenase subunit n=1 Tax=Marinomonas balearica TaxID=491947 RepID=A0A4R6M5P6_9GAMM|nr:aromatic ring-hydroxylating dioxygenase subunit alpha [Marinomonas balearica]TDO96406.1 vanillate O-demethylase monooxygenase subunit [Marinomonas balearica]